MICACSFFLRVRLGFLVYLNKLVPLTSSWSHFACFPLRTTADARFFRYRIPFQDPFPMPITLPCTFVSLSQRRCLDSVVCGQIRPAFAASFFPPPPPLDCNSISPSVLLNLFQEYRVISGWPTYLPFSPIFFFVYDVQCWSYGIFY